MGLYSTSNTAALIPEVQVVLKTARSLLPHVGDKVEVCTMVLNAADKFVANPTTDWQDLNRKNLYFLWDAFKEMTSHLRQQHDEPRRYPIEMIATTISAALSVAIDSHKWTSISISDFNRMHAEWVRGDDQ